MPTYSFPGALPDIADGDTIYAEYIQAIRDRANHVYDTVADLESGESAPDVGQTAVVTADGAATGIYEYSGSTDGWTKPWNLPWGPVGRSKATGSENHHSSTEYVIPSLATTFTAVANRNYRIWAKVDFRNDATGAVHITLKAKDGTTQIEDAQVWVTPSSGAANDHNFIIEVETTLSAGSHTINVTIQSDNAAGTDIWAGSRCIIEDIGPAEAPA